SCSTHHFVRTFQCRVSGSNRLPTRGRAAGIGRANGPERCRRRPCCLSDEDWRVRRTDGVLRRPVTALLLTIALAAGCGESADDASRTPRSCTSGTLLYAGEALSDAQVTYHPVASDRVPASGRTDADGYYASTTYEASDGTVAGSFFVT